jgi:hypothetical protein
MTFNWYYDVHFLEIEDFFTPEECELVIDLAKAKGMKKIPAFKGVETMFKDEIHETFKMWNLNGDEFVDANEVRNRWKKTIFLWMFMKFINLCSNTH